MPPRNNLRWRRKREAATQMSLSGVPVETLRPYKRLGDDTSGAATD